MYIYIYIYMYMHIKVCQYYDLMHIYMVQCSIAWYALLPPQHPTKTVNPYVLACAAPGTTNRPTYMLRCVPNSLRNFSVLGDRVVWKLLIRPLSAKPRRATKEGQWNMRTQIAYYIPCLSLLSMVLRIPVSF